MTEDKSPAESGAETEKPHKGKKIAKPLREALDMRIAGFIADAEIARGQIRKHDYMGAEHSLNECAQRFAVMVDAAIDAFSTLPDDERVWYPGEDESDELVWSSGDLAP